MLEAGYYSIITHDVLYDNKLTANEKLLYASITGLTKQKGYCYASNDYFADKLNTSKRSVARWLNNLETKGYIKRILIYGKDSKEVKERQIYTSLNGGDKNDSSDTDDKGSCRDCHDPHDTDVSTPHDTDGTVNRELINSQVNSKDNKDVSDKEIEERFENIWKEYPRKKGKTAALKHYKKHIKENDFTDEVVLKKIEEYKKEIEVKKTKVDFIMYGSTFFNNGWEDEFEYQNGRGGYDTTEYDDFFSSVGEVLTEQLIKVEEICEVHEVNLVTAFGREPVCLECAKEKRDAEHETLQEELTNRHLKRSTYDWLKQKSIYLDETLDSATFDSFKTEDRETKENKETALNIAREYYKGASYNTILSGKAGTGKSHLAMSILKVVNEHSKPYKKCLFISIDELMRRIKDGFSNKDSIHTEQRMADMLIETDLLVIDDLGAETGSIHSDKSATDFTTRTLYGIINGRMKKPTIITTNLSSKEMAQMYDSKLISRMFRGAKGHVISFKETDDKRIDIEF